MLLIRYAVEQEKEIHAIADWTCDVAAVAADCEEVVAMDCSVGCSDLANSACETDFDFDYEIRRNHSEHYVSHYCRHFDLSVMLWEANQ